MKCFLFNQMAKNVLQSHYKDSSNLLMAYSSQGKTTYASKSGATWDNTHRLRYEFYKHNMKVSLCFCPLDLCSCHVNLSLKSNTTKTTPARWSTGSWWLKEFQLYLRYFITTNTNKRILLEILMIREGSGIFSNKSRPTSQH